MAALRAKVVTLTTAGGAGASGGTASFNLPPCRLYAAAVDQPGASPATTDVTLVINGVTYTLAANSGADAVKYFRAQAHQPDGTAVPAGDGERWVHPVISGQVDFIVAQSNDGAFTFTLYYEPT